MRAYDTRDQQSTVRLPFEQLRGVQPAL